MLTGASCYFVGYVFAARNENKQLRFENMRSLRSFKGPLKLDCGSYERRYTAIFIILLKTSYAVKYIVAHISSLLAHFR